MYASDLIRIFESRHIKISKVLKDKEVSGKKRYELVGAMNEIKLFLRTLDKYSELSSNREEVALISPQAHENGLFANIISIFL